MLRRCLDCPRLIRAGSRCPDCARRYRSPHSRHGWADAVKRRDGYRCVQCGSADRVAADHIVPLSAGGADTLQNGRTLCDSCHKARHRGR